MNMILKTLRRGQGMRKRTKEYAGDYELSGAACPDGRRAPRYTGKYCRFMLPKEKLRAYKLKYALLLLALAVLYAGIGLLGSTALGGRGAPPAVYVALPYALLLLPVGLSLGRGAVLIALKRPLERAAYDRYLLRQKGTLAAALACALALALGLCLFLVLGSYNKILPELPALAAAVLFTVCAFCLLRLHGKLLKSAEFNA